MYAGATGQPWPVGVYRVTVMIARVVDRNFIGRSDETPGPQAGSPAALVVCDAAGDRTKGSDERSLSRILCKSEVT